MKERNVGIDFLRLLSMFMVVVIHVLGKGKLLSYAPGSLYYKTGWFLETSCICAVNCFAIISGYVLCDAKITLKRILMLWLQVVFYTVVISFVMFHFYDDLWTNKNILNAIFPVTRRQYWYISCYFGLYAIMPFLNYGIQKIEKKEFRNILILSFIAMSIMPTLFRNDPFSLVDGYSIPWLCMMYILGGYIKEHKLFFSIKKRYLFLFFWIAVTITFANRFLIEGFIAKEDFLYKYAKILLSYVSFTNIFSAIFLFCLCVKLKFNNLAKKIILFLSPSALAVFLIHVHPFIWTKFIDSFALKGGNFFGYHFSSFVGDGVLVMVYKTFIASFIIFFFCIFCDLIRRLIFKILKINFLCTKFSEILGRKFL